MNYLISGVPRTRTAWLCALMNAHGSLCYHDAITNNLDLTLDAGLADPTMACLFPVEALRLLRGNPAICIRRIDWREAFEAWAGVEFTDRQADQWEQHCQIFAGGSISVMLSELEDDHVVKEIIETCAPNLNASLGLIQIFQGLKIEQHLEKAQRSLQISRSA